MTAVGRFSTRPLYLQVKDTLIERILAGAWKPGAAIPNEIELSRELGISVGTVRKALDEMEGDRLISRRQGRGTFVIDQTSEECAIRFSNIRDADGIRIAGTVESCEIISAGASETEADRVSTGTAISGIRVTPMPALTIWTSVDSEFASSISRGGADCMLQKESA